MLYQRDSIAESCHWSLERSFIGPTFVPNTGASKAHYLPYASEDCRGYIYGTSWTKSTLDLQSSMLQARSTRRNVYPNDKRSRLSGTPCSQIASRMRNDPGCASAYFSIALWARIGGKRKGAAGPQYVCACRHYGRTYAHTSRSTLA